MSDLTILDRVTLQAIWDGLTTKEMAHQFDLSNSAIDRRRTMLMRKLGTQNVVQLVRKGLRDGLLSL